MNDMNQRTISLRDFLRVVFKRKFIILSLFFCITATVTVGSFLTPKLYRASSTIMINQESKDVIVLTPNRSFSYRQSREETIASEVEIMKCREVIKRMIHYLGPNDELSNNNQEGLISKFQKAISINPVKNSNIIEVSYEGEDPELAARAVNCLIQAYKDFQSTLFQDVESLEFFGHQIRLTKDKLEDMRQSLDSFRTEQEIVAPEEQKRGLLDRLNTLEQKLVDIKGERTRQEMRIAEFQQLCEKDSENVTLPLASGNADWSNANLLHRKIVELEMERNRLLAEKFTEDYEGVATLTKQITQARKMMKKETKRLLAIEQAALKSLIAEEEILQTQANKLRMKLRALPKEEERYANLSRGIEDYEKIYSVLLQRQEETRISRATDKKNINIQVIGPALVPNAPVKPRIELNILLAIVLSLFLGFGIAFFMEYMDHSVKTASDVETYLDLPLLTSVREIKQTNDRGNGRRKGEVVNKNKT